MRSVNKDFLKFVAISPVEREICMINDTTGSSISVSESKPEWGQGHKTLLPTLIYRQQSRKCWVVKTAAHSAGAF